MELRAKYLYTSLLFFFLLGMIACRKDTDKEQSRLKPIAVYTLGIPETSGLCWFGNRGSLLTVSDSLGKVFEISKEGIIMDTLAYTGGNPEGIAYNDKTNTILVLEENKKEIVEIDTLGNEIRTIELNIPVQIAKHGPEGLAIDTATQTLFVLREKYPGTIYRYTYEGHVTDSVYIDFASDFSGMYYDQEGSFFWIVSDESKMVARCNPSGFVLESWSLDFNKGEGIAIDNKERRIYIVTDSDNQLYIYSY
ncbi:MAG: SdiA-regulated domain-containing protein [Bacteroidales bacterium]|nr:SdiA-regulated domain-containing protein [Bacteroidales bacterium]